MSNARRLSGDQNGVLTSPKLDPRASDLALQLTAVSIGPTANIHPVSVPFQASIAPSLSSSPAAVCCGTPSHLTNRTASSISERATCLVIYTGGTFGMVPDAHGVLHPSSGFLATKIAEMDEFQFANMPSVTVLEWDDPIDSSDMTPEDWKRLAVQIEHHYWEFDGFVVLHGTDTMAYAAAALSFMLEYLGKPVVFAGAMIPLHFPHSDGRRNLIMSVLCAATLAIPEVCIYSNDKLLRGNRTTKIANMSVEAFQSPNFPLLATTGVETIVDQALILPYPRRRFMIFTELATRVCVYNLVPGFDDECIEAYIDRVRAKQALEKTVEKRETTQSAIVFALYGTGNASTRKDGFLRLVQLAIESNIVVCITTQCVQGRTQLDIYATGARLLEMGVITSLDMTVEATVTKLAYLMGKGITGADLKVKMESDLRGELSVVDSFKDVDEMSYTREHRKAVINILSTH